MVLERLISTCAHARQVIILRQFALTEKRSWSSKERMLEFTAVIVRQGQIRCKSKLHC
jgi:hypothetical protein